MKTKLQKTIMRRVYYAYALRLVTTPGLGQGFLMGASLIALMNMVSFSNVFTNLMGVPVGQLDQFVYNAVTTTEAWTLLLLGVLIFSALSFRFSLHRQSLDLMPARAS